MPKLPDGLYLMAETLFDMLDESKGIRSLDDFHPVHAPEKYKYIFGEGQHTFADTVTYLNDPPVAGFILRDVNGEEYELLIKKLP